MRVFKDHSFLVFDVDGKQCKYDFATKQAYGFSGKPVKNISSQLRNHSIGEIIQSCDQPGYGYFLYAVKSYYGDSYSNIGTLLDKARYFAHLEPFYTAGVKKIRNIQWFHGRFNDVPTGLIKLFRDYDLPLDDELITSYKENPDMYNVLFKTKYTTLQPGDLCGIAEYSGRILKELVSTYKYQPKALFLYLDRIATFEAMLPRETLVTLRDTIRMSASISPKYDKFPRYLKTTHDIVQRNYDRMKREFNDELFARRVKPQMERNIDGYAFIYPKTPQDIKDEAVQQNNCVASYIDRVIEGRCDIVFMRRKESPEHSLVTLEVVDGKVVQRKQRYNYDTTAEQDAIIAKWEAWLQDKAA